MPNAFLLPPRWVGRSPLIPTRPSQTPPSPREGFGRELPADIQSFRPIDSPGRARLAEFPRPQAGKKNESCFDRLRNAKTYFSPSLSSWAVRVHPQFWEPSAAGPKIPCPPWCSFLRLSSKESRAPSVVGGAPGRCAPKVLRSYPPVGYAALCCPWQGDRVWTGAGSGRKPSRGGTTLCYGTQSPEFPPPPGRAPDTAPPPTGPGGEAPCGSLRRPSKGQFCRGAGRGGPQGAHPTTGRTKAHTARPPGDRGRPRPGSPAPLGPGSASRFPSGPPPGRQRPRPARGAPAPPDGGEEGGVRPPEGPPPAWESKGAAGCVPSHWSSRAWRRQGDVLESNVVSNTRDRATDGWDMAVPPIGHRRPQRGLGEIGFAVGLGPGQPGAAGGQGDAQPVCHLLVGQALLVVKQQDLPGPGAKAGWGGPPPAPNWGPARRPALGEGCQGNLPPGPPGPLGEKVWLSSYCAPGAATPRGIGVGLEGGRLLVSGQKDRLDQVLGLVGVPQPGPGQAVKGFCVGEVGGVKPLGFRMIHGSPLLPIRSLSDIHRQDGGFSPPAGRIWARQTAGPKLHGEAGLSSQAVDQHGNGAFKVHPVPVGLGVLCGLPDGLQGVVHGDLQGA